MPTIKPSFCVFVASHRIAQKDLLFITSKNQNGKRERKKVVMVFYYTEEQSLSWVLEILEYKFKLVETFCIQDLCWKYLFWITLLEILYWKYLIGNTYVQIQPGWNALHPKKTFIGLWSRWQKTWKLFLHFSNWSIKSCSLFSSTKRKVSKWS